MVESKIIYKGDFTKENIKLEFVNEQHQFRPDFENKIQDIWDQFVAEAKAKGLNPWDGSYYRIANFDEFVSGKIKLLKLSTVSYSRIKALGKFSYDYSLSPNEYTYHISTGAVIETADEYFVMGKRGNTMSNSNVDFIGGGLQSDELEVKSIDDLETNVRKEMFEETNITPGRIENSSGLGIIFSSTSNVLFFYKVKLNINSTELKDIFKNRVEEEMSDLLLMQREEYLEYLKTLGGYRPLIADLLV